MEQFEFSLLYPTREQKAAHEAGEMRPTVSEETAESLGLSCKSAPCSLVLEIDLGHELSVVCKHSTVSVCNLESCHLLSVRLDFSLVYREGVRRHSDSIIRADLLRAAHDHHQWQKVQ